MAQSYWPNEDPLGKRFRSVKPNSPWITVIGVLANARTQSLTRADIPEIYFDLYQTGAQRLAILLRGHLNVAAIPEQVRKQVQAVDPTLPVYGAQTLKETVSDSLAQRRFTLELVTMFGLTALFLAALGIYGVISYLVSERCHEIGIRRALGAQNRNILELVLRQGIGLAVAGAALGLLCALVVSRLMSSVLFGVKPYDPAVFLSVPFLLLIVALIASYLPARRATKIDPIIALRDS
jgi:predicted lysophospholipase L1 biosynthesis ABC-type transport system permease subunit